eukprot:8633968-Heterocapsa_arctica.AAC.1
MFHPSAVMPAADMPEPRAAGEGRKASQSVANAENLGQANPMPEATLPRPSSAMITGRSAAPAP